MGPGMAKRRFPPGDHFTTAGKKSSSRETTKSAALVWPQRVSACCLSYRSLSARPGSWTDIVTSLTGNQLLHSGCRHSIPAGQSRAFCRVVQAALGLTIRSRQGKMRRTRPQWPITTGHSRATWSLQAACAPPVWGRQRQPNMKRGSLPGYGRQQPKPARLILHGKGREGAKG